MEKSKVVKYLLILLYAKIETVACRCIMDVDSRSYYKKPCVGLFTCWDSITGVTSQINNWNCRRRYGPPDKEFYLYVKLHNSSPYKIQGDFSDLSDEYKLQITSISITNVTMESIDTFVYSLLNATNIELPHNGIESFALSKFSLMKSLETLNVSHNAIETLKMDNGTLVAVESLHVLDLSHNLIEAVPQHYFQYTPQLLHLNLSHNSIELFDDLTFEGLPQLRTLTLTNNKLTQIGSAIGRLTNLQELRLDFNYFKSLDDIIIGALPSLQKLSVSNNDLKYIGSSLQYTLALTELDLSHNNMEVVLKSQVFRFVSHLTSLDLSYNKISRIEPTAFKDKNITNFRIDNNNLTGILDDNTFEGTNSDKLDLSGGKLLELGSELFVGQNLQLRVLNFSNNFIFNIKQSSFHNVKLLTKLDLSINRLQCINFDTIDLGNLTHFYAKNNFIKKITKDFMSNFVSLTILDVSHNAIEDIEDQAFVNLDHLEFLILHNNPLSKAIKAETFYGLNLRTGIDLSFSNIISLKNETLKDMLSLQTFNASFGDINTIEFKFFHGSRSIEIINLSNNQIKIFLVNNQDIKQAREIYLSNNKLEYISNNTFYGLKHLEILNLDFNKIASIQPGSFVSTQSIQSLNLHNNNLQSFQFGIFDGMTQLKYLNLSRNALTSIAVHLFHKNSELHVLALDNNYINNINCYELKRSPIKKLTLGGNLFKCAIILKCIQDNTGIDITAENKIIHTENIQGITCNSESRYVIETRLVNGSMEGNNNAASGHITIQPESNTTMKQNCDTNCKTPEKVTGDSINNLNSAINHMVVCLVVIACILFLILSVVSLNSYKKHWTTNRYHVNHSDISLVQQDFS